MTKKEIQNILTKKMRNALNRANDYSSINLDRINEYHYYRGLADGYLKAKELVGNIDNKDANNTIKYLAYFASVLAEGVLEEWNEDDLKEQAKELANKCNPYLYGKNSKVCK